MQCACWFAVRFVMMDDGQPGSRCLHGSSIIMLDHEGLRNLVTIVNQKYGV